ncbi:MAG: T9SS type A sorting domain-containing protein [Chitinivibrionales bacterium]|nr:T9SS type A sorting domain-containing protein [Chitinivibrionales bacterium]
MISFKIGIRLLIAGALLGVFNASETNALNNGVARTPPMGFNTWNWFAVGNMHGPLDETLMKGLGDAMVSTGMRDAGFRYVNLDDAWAAQMRDANGGLVANAGFPHGLKPVADYLHAKGLKLGVYTGIMGSCSGFMPGLNFGNAGGGGDHTAQDADSFVAWGVDFVKVDRCGVYGGFEAIYRSIGAQFHAAVARMLPKVPTANEMVFSLCEWGMESPWQWGDTVGNMWRTTTDITPGFLSALGNMDQNCAYYPYSGIGAWNDPDMLEVGNGMTNTQGRAHFSLWCMMAAPLIVGNDIRNMDDSTKAILTNQEVTAVDQDTLGGVTKLGVIQGRRVISANGNEVWVKQLKDTNNADYAILFFNRSNNSATRISISTAQIASVGGGMAAGKSYYMRDLWGKKDLGAWIAGDSLTTPAPVPPNDVFMVRLSAAAPTGVAVPAVKSTTEPAAVMLDKRLVVITAGRPGPLSADLVDARGALVRSLQANGGNRCVIDARSLSAGVYFVNVRCAGQTVVRRIVLK